MRFFAFVLSFMLAVGSSGLVVNSIRANGVTSQCNGTWCTVYFPFSEETFCCEDGTFCPDPQGGSVECVEDEGGYGEA